MSGVALFAIACVAAGATLGLVAALGNNTLRAHAGESSRDSLPYSGDDATGVRRETKPVTVYSSARRIDGPPNASRH